MSPEYTHCEEYTEEKGAVIRNILESKHETYCLATQFGTTIHTPITGIKTEPTRKPSGNNAPPKGKTNNVDIIIITIIIILAILVVSLMVVYMYVRRLKVHIFLPMNDPHPPIRLQEIDHSQENIAQELIRE